MPPIPVYQFSPPATTWALVDEYGAAPATSGTICAIAVTSGSVNVVRLPVPRLTPPLEIAPGMTTIRFAPRLSICASTAACAPAPMAIDVITAPTPMMMPSIVRIDRVTLRRSACQAIRIRPIRFMRAPPASLPRRAPRVRTAGGMTSADGRSSMMRPSLNVTTRSVHAATVMSWVTTTTVMPWSRLSPRNSAMMSALLALSRLPVGSSAMSSGARFASARPIATRCCWPPDSSLGR